jgi:hypothetical protein
LIAATLLALSSLLLSPSSLAPTVQAAPIKGAPIKGASIIGAAAAIAATAPRAPSVASLRPHIVWKPIPYGARRRRQMGAYSKRHYGVWKWKLTGPVAIVEHYTTGTTWQGAWNTFAANSKHLGEYPGTCGGSSRRAGTGVGRYRLLTR